MAYEKKFHLKKRLQVDGIPLFLSFFFPLVSSFEEIFFFFQLKFNQVQKELTLEFRNQQTIGLFYSIKTDELLLYPVQIFYKL